MVDKFKHITVSPEPEEDVVIYAGLGKARSDDVSEDVPDDIVGASSDDVLADARSDTPNGFAEDAAYADVEAARTTTAEREDVSDALRAATGSGSAASAERDPDELTLEDLKSSRMPLTQRIVIVAVVVCLIGAIVYYMAFMR